MSLDVPLRHEGEEEGRLLHKAGGKDIETEGDIGRDVGVPGRQGRVAVCVVAGPGGVVWGLWGEEGCGRISI